MDLLSILPTFEVVSSSYKLAKSARLLKIFRFTKIIHYIGPLEIFVKVIKKQWKLLLAVALALLLISLALIVNTIRLQIYAKRFIINTMTLVGATSWVTRRPFVGRNMLMGFLSGLVALAILSGIVYYVEVRLGILLFPPTWQNIAFVSAVVLCCGLLITLLASLIATGRYIRMDNNSLYEI